MCFAKNGLAVPSPRTKVQRSSKLRGGTAHACRGRGKPASTSGTVAGCPRCSGCCGCSLLIYPPTRAQWGARAGGLWGGFPNPEKLICMCFAKNGLAVPSPRTKVQRTAAKAARQPHLPTRLPCTSRLPTRLPYTQSKLPCTSRLPNDLPYAFPSRRPYTSRLLNGLPYTPSKLPYTSRLPNGLPCTPTRLPCTAVSRVSYPTPLLLPPS